jgi:exopolyphosphatase/guanosine-5'-triphosphate,3'-diphosphate pyrophosphatase
MEIENGEDDISLLITTESDPELEIWGAMRKSYLFEQVTGKSLEIHRKEGGDVIEMTQPDPYPERKA